MRKDLLEYYCSLASENENLFILTSDLGYGIFSNFRHNNIYVRCINVGIAESNMISIAAGLSLSGSRVICYSMASFSVLRALEQIKIDLCCNNADVIIVGAGSGLTCGLEGVTHHMIEDIAVLKAFPNITIVCPCDRQEAIAVAKSLSNHHGPVYFRIGQERQETVHRYEPITSMGRGLVVRKGKDVAIFSHGDMVYCSQQVAVMLESSGIYATVISCPWIKPFDITGLKKIIDSHSSICVIEEHEEHGGLSSDIAMYICKRKLVKHFITFCASYDHHHMVGTSAFLRQSNGLSANHIAHEIMTMVSSC